MASVALDFRRCGCDVLDDERILEAGVPRLTLSDGIKQRKDGHDDGGWLKWRRAVYYALTASGRMGETAVQHDAGCWAERDAMSRPLMER